jgi:hypothetical protein
VIIIEFHPAQKKIMLTRDIASFFRYATSCQAQYASHAKAVYLVTPEGFSLSPESAQDNVYMAMQSSVKSDLAMRQHQHLAHVLSHYLPVITFPGRMETPDAVFPNNVFATASNRLILGHMKHAVRQAEADRADITSFFTKVLGYECVNLRMQPGICELTGSLIIDHSRNIGFCGLSERCDEIGAQAMMDAFGLKACLLFELAKGEYHTNVVLSILAGRAVVIAPSGFADAAVSDAITQFYSPHALVLSPAEKNAFAANVIALSARDVWMSQTAANHLSAFHRDALDAAGFAMKAVELSEIEKAGGSLRCCVGEIF